MQKLQSLLKYSIENIDWTILWKTKSNLSQSLLSDRLQNYKGGEILNGNWVWSLMDWPKFATFQLCKKAFLLLCAKDRLYT